MEFGKDIRSNRVALLPFCLLCQAYQAEGIVRKFPAVVTPVIAFLATHDVNMLQMPCPESLYGGLGTGLGRKPRSFAQYDTPEFHEHCRCLAQEMTSTARTLVSHGFEITAVLGVEFSPSCAVNLQYVGHAVRRAGIYMSCLMEQFAESELKTSFMGVNRRGVGAAVDRLSRIVATRTEHSLELRWQRDTSL